MGEFVSKKLLVAKFNELASKYIDGDKKQRGLAYATAADIIAFTVAADVQPVKHGRWIEETPKHSRCSCCDVTCLIAVYPISANANFCPNCGARMDIIYEDDKIRAIKSQANDR